jgi:hypothetical protein
MTATSSFAQEVVENELPAPLAFIENKGQFTDMDGYAMPDVRYLLRSPGLNVILRDKGFSYEMRSGATDTRASSGGFPPSLPSQLQVSRIDIDFEGCAGIPGISSSDALEFYENYYTAQRVSPDRTVEKVFTRVPAYSKVTYHSVYPGISIEFVTTDGDKPMFKYNIIAEPGADLSRLKFRYSGADPRVLNGVLSMKMPTGTLEERIPTSWYGEERDHQTVEAHYTAHANDVSLLGFTVAGGTPVLSDRRLVIDPTPVWNWGTYFNGAVADNGRGVVSNGSNIYICGVTASTGLGTVGQTTYGGGFYDGFMAKYTSAGALSWVTYYGGTGIDAAEEVDVDQSGNVFVCGYTGSTTGIATTFGGEHQTALSGVQDAFLAKFTSAGVRLWGTYFGGTSAEQAFSVSVSGSDVFISGITQSANGIGTAGVYEQTQPGGTFDTYVAKFSGANGSRTWGSYYGGPGQETFCFVDAGIDGNIYLTGNTNSTSQIATAGSYQSTIGGGQDSYLAKLNGTTGARIWGTYYGGLTTDGPFEIEVNCDTKVFIVGQTNSSTGIATAGAHQTVKAAGDDGFLACFTSAGAISWATYYGSDNTDDVSGVTVLGNGIVFIGGSTTGASAGTAIATASSPQPAFGGGTNDGFLASFTTAGVRNWGTYYGGSATDAVTSIHTSGNKLYSTGYTTSSNNISTLNTYTAGTGNSAFLGNHAAGATTDCSIGGGGEDGMILDGEADPGSAEHPTVRAWPNPAGSRVTLFGATWEGLSSIEIFDVQGRPCRISQHEEVRPDGSSENVQVNLLDLSPGLYTLRLSYADDRQVITRLVIQR